jgi:hypothetical protein
MLRTLKDEIPAEMGKTEKDFTRIVGARHRGQANVHVVSVASWVASEL